MKHFYHVSEIGRRHLFFLLMFILTSLVSAQNLPAGFARVNVASGISSLTSMAFAPDGRIFVCQQTGQLRIIKNGALLPTPFMSLSVSSSGERGLLGIALDPNFATNQYLYVYYTLASGANNRISRFTANGDVVVPGSEVVVLNLAALGASNHNGGCLKFGPDGKLYIGTGDNNNTANSQNLDSYLGKVLRINSDGSVPTGNPFTTGSEQRRRVWAYGLRNPFTMNFHPTSGRLFVNDVGQTAYEEINDATAGGRNFGWPLREGPSTDYVTPVYSYKHLDNGGIGCSIVGGLFYNPSSTNWPSQYIGRYFYNDYCGAFIHTIDVSGANAVQSAFATGLVGPLTALEMGPDGNIYYHDRGSNVLYKIIYTLNSTPVIVTQPVNVTVSEGQPASFSVTATGAATLTYQWQRNNVNIAGATSATYNIGATTIAQAGNYRCIVTNGSGSATSNNAVLTVTAFNAAPTATILTPAAGTMYRGGETISFSGNGTDPEDGTLAASAFTWYIDFHHDTHTHPAMARTTGSKTGSYTIPISGEQSDNVWYRIYLEVVDSKGLKKTTYVDVMPHKTNMSFATQPAGLQIALDGQPISTPVTIAGVEGITRSIAAITQTSGGITYEFDKWLHGGAAVQDISTPLDNITYTAVYKQGAVNLALNKPTTVSSVEATGLEGSKAVDGSGTTRWASLYTDPQSLYVDLGATYDINRVKITWEAAYGRNYEVQISSNATTWTPIRIVTNNTTLVNDWTALSGTGRYIRIYGTARGTVYGYSIFELEVYGTPGCTAPAQPAAISGNTAVLAGSAQTYSVAAVSGATSYTWTLPSGWSGTSTTNSIAATAGAAGGTISVIANNSCGASPARTLAVTISCPLPAQPAAISGNISVIGGSAQTYSVAAVSGTTSYTWTLPSGWAGTSTTNSITTTAGTVGGTISVVANNSCGASPARTLAVSVSCSTPPAQPAAISGNTAVVAGSAQTYSVAAVSGATSYTWTLPSGWSGTSTTNSIAATVGAAGGTISVIANNACGSSTARTLVITITCPLPAQPAAISGNTSVLAGSAQTYSVAAVSGITYTWTLPSGWAGTSTTSSIAATVGTAGGTISVVANNSCGASAARTLAVTIGTPTSNLALNKPATVSSIETGTTFTGANAVDGSGTTRWSSLYVDPSWIQVDLQATYNVNRVKIVWEAAYATAYQVQISNDATSWSTIRTVSGNTTLTNDWTGLVGTGRYIRIYGTARATVYGYSIFELEVYGTSGCTVPAQPAAISGNTSVTAGSAQTYSVAAVSTATSYTWTLPSGWVGTSTTNSISTTAGTAGGTISVIANNSCGASPARTLAVSISCPLPAQPAAITGNATVAAGSTQTYSVATVSGATSYAWTLPSGWSGSSTTNSISTTVGTAGGTISVVANNSCGASPARTMAVSITTPPSSNLALNKPTTVSSIEPTTAFNGANAVDGNPATRWSSNYVDPSWIYVDLQASYNVNRVKIVWEAAYATAYQVQISSDATNWTSIKTVSGNATLTNDWTGLAGTGRYIRIYGTARNSQWGYSIFELEVYGTSAAPSFAPAATQTAIAPIDQKLTAGPNPTSDFIKIFVNAETSGNYSLIVYDKLGGQVDVLADGYLQAGHHDFELDLSRETSGVYFVKLLGNKEEVIIRIQKQ